MGFPENVLTHDERVVKELHPHWMTVAVPTLIGIVLVGLAAAGVVLTPVSSTWSFVEWVILGVAALLMLWLVVLPYARWRTTHYVITSHRVMARSGILSKRGKDIALGKITDVSFNRTLLDRIVGAGSLHIESAGDSPDEDLTNIPNSDEIQQLLNRLIDEDDQRRRLMGHGCDPGT